MQTKEDIFWKWFKIFSKNFSFDSEGYLIYTDKMEDQLEKAIKSYDEDLGIVIGSENRAVDMIVTAYGDKSKFGRVNTLVKSAPAFDNINVIALKPPADDPVFTTDYKGEKINSREVYFDVFENKNDKKKVGIDVFFRKENLDKNLYIEIAVIMCESIVGERGYAEYIELIDVGVANKKDLEKHIPLTRLKSYVDWHINKYVGS
jgi:hypothetical protein